MTATEAANTNTAACLAATHGDINVLFHPGNYDAVVDDIERSAITTKPEDSQS